MLSDLATPTTFGSEHFLAATDQDNVSSSVAILIQTHESFVHNNQRQMANDRAAP